MREFLHARESGQLTEHSSATVAEYLEQWLANIEPNARKTTFNGYRNDIGRIVRVLGNVRLQELTPMQLESAYADMVKHGSMIGGTLSPKTVYNAHSTLRHALNDAVRLGILIRNPVTAARSPKWTKPDIATWTAPSSPSSSPASRTTRSTPPTCSSPPPACVGVRRWGCAGRTSTSTRVRPHPPDPHHGERRARLRHHQDQQEPAPHQPRPGHGRIPAQPSSPPGSGSSARRRRVGRLERSRLHQPRRHPSPPRPLDPPVQAPRQGPRPSRASRPALAPPHLGHPRPRGWRPPQDRERTLRTLDHRHHPRHLQPRRRRHGRRRRQPPSPTRSSEKNADG